MWLQRSKAALEVDTAARLRATPPGATCKGALFAGIIDQARRARPNVDLAREAGIEDRRYVPFLNYPYPDLLRLIPAAARVAFPSAPLAEAVRRLGQGVFVDFRTSRSGRVLLGLMVDDLTEVLLSAPRAYAATVMAGRVSAERLGPRRVRVCFDDYPGYIESYDVGIFEGAIAYFREPGAVRATRSGPRSGTIDVEWGARATSAPPGRLTPAGTLKPLGAI